MRGARSIAVLALFGGALSLPRSASPQERRARVGVTSLAVIAATRVSPTPLGTGLTEVLVEQPVIMAHAAAPEDRLRLDVTLNLEGLSMPDGVLGIGVWGEGFIDRRHPHTYLHELMFSTTYPVWPGLRLSGAAGKGFVPFGTDDPMNRPALRFPVNHHLSQVLERAVLLVGVQAGPVALEGSVFNGDEPERPSQWPNVPDRFADSWSLRLTAWPAPGVEAQVSRASVQSPEHRPGAGPPQDKWSGSARFDRTVGKVQVYVLGEWARTEDAGGFFVFTTALTETQIALASHRAYYRWERTSRPEEVRRQDPFRGVRPHLDDGILGISRWSTHTLGYAVALRLFTSWLSAEPVAELSLARATSVGGGLFRIEDLYSRRTFTALTLGLRVRQGAAHRMGRYGVLQGADLRAAAAAHPH